MAQGKEVFSLLRIPHLNYLVTPIAGLSDKLAHFHQEDAKITACVMDVDRATGGGNMDPISFGLTFSIHK